ncbi:MAG: ribose import ATP-binding protein RbsA [Cyclobacteriaceae bacterium]|nr:MAG: ribose import ATP-binding protein RbsA [Cyclobacteriaceae bacterium]
MLSLDNIRKSFGPVEILKGISFTVRKGQTLGLVGENGAGKSTLMNILGGVYEPNEGQIQFNGNPYRPARVSDSIQQGIAFIHQELNLFPNLTIMENLFLNEFPRKQGLFKYFIDQKKILEQSQMLLKQVGLSVSPFTRVSDLTNGPQQLVEIAKALKGQPRLIIFDEPTTALSQAETDQLLQLIRKLKQRQVSIIFISHNLDEVKAISDTIAVIRDGSLIKVKPAAQYAKSDIIRDMVGRDLEQFFPERNCVIGKLPKLQVNDLNVDGKNQLSFEIKEREVVGVYGLVGAGRSEMARGLFGLSRVYQGSVKWNGVVYDKFKPRQWIKQGVVYLTEDRREEGILSFKSVLENVQLASLHQFVKAGFGWLDHKGILSGVKEKVKATRVKYQTLESQPVSELSGGNQQKVLLSRWLMTNPGLLMLDEPTKGIDIGAREEIYHLINRVVEQDSCVLLISSEIEELLGMCDRILVMNQGRITATFPKTDFNRSEILKYALNATKE